MKVAIIALAALFSISTSNAGTRLVIADGSHAKCILVQQAGATEPEKHASRELAEALQKITGEKFELQDGGDVANDQTAIIIGPGAIAQKFFSDVNLTGFGGEQLIMRSKGNKLLLAGGRPRGTVYAVNRFLQEQCGVRWWMPWAANYPQKKKLSIASLDVREQPAFEYRGPYWFPGFDPLWRVRNCSNNESWDIPANLGGCIRYKGFCHTFNALVPPEKHFKEHPEWFSMIKGKRVGQDVQLCLTNPQLRDFMVGRVKEWLRESPDCQIVSVTQNDHNGWCECPDCKALDDAEGSHAGTMIAFVNYIAEKIEAEFPNIWVDTFAYTYTRTPPKTVRPRHNVIVRLCSIESNFRQPLDAPVNAAFLADLKRWSQLCSHLYVWDYTCEFSHYVHPHPNWFTLGQNVRVFQKAGVKGLFEQGAYAGYGPEMGELRAWVLAQLLWNPQQDDKALIREFLEGYYGEASAKPIYQYLELLSAASKDFFLACYMRKDPPPYLDFNTLQAVELLWQQAETAAAGDVEKLERIRIGHLPVLYAFLKDWTQLRSECWEQNKTWPLNQSRKAVAEQFRIMTAGTPGKDWTQVRVLNERGLQVETFLKKFEQDPSGEKFSHPPIPRLKNPAAPDDISKGLPRGCIDLQDNLAGLYRRGEFSDITPDPAASDHRAVWMPATHEEWAFRISGKELPKAALSKKWKMYVAVRADADSSAKGQFFTTGVYDNVAQSYPATLHGELAGATAKYRSWLAGEFTATKDRDIFVAPTKNSAVKAIYVDRVYLVPAE